MTRLSMKVNLPPLWQARLLNPPTAIPLLLPWGRTSDESALAIPADTLFRYRRVDFSTTVRLVGTQGKEGVWIVVVAFRVIGSRSFSSAGLAYLNPRQEEGRQLLRAFTLQEQLPLVFFSPPLTVAVRQETVWSVYHRQEARVLLSQVDYALGGSMLHGERDPDFERTRDEFQQQYTAALLLSGREGRETPLSSPLRGVVLD